MRNVRKRVLAIALSTRYLGREGEARRKKQYEELLSCVNGRGLFLGMGCRGRGSSPSPAQRFRSSPSFHCVTLSMAGIRSGHRIVKWFGASRQ